MSYDRHPIAAAKVVPMRGAKPEAEAVPAYSVTPSPAAVPAADGALSPIEQMFAYYDTY